MPKVLFQIGIDSAFKSANVIHEHMNKKILEFISVSHVKIRQIANVKMYILVIDCGTIGYLHDFNINPTLQSKFEANFAKRAL